MASHGINLLLNKEGADRAQGLVTGWAAVSTDENGDYIRDSDGDIVTIEALEGLAAQVMIDGQSELVVGENHIGKNRGAIVESMVVDREKRAALGFGEGVGGWVVTLKITDRELFDKILSGDMPELSIFANGTRDENGDYSKLEKKPDETLSIVDRGASGNKQNRPAIVLAKRSENGMTLEEILAALGEEERKIVMDAIAAGADSKEANDNVETESTGAADVAGTNSDVAKRDDVIKRLQQDNESLASKIAAVENERAIELLSKRAAIEMPNIPSVTFDEMGEMLKSIEDNIPATIAKRLVSALTAASAALGTTFGSEPIGSEQRGSVDAYGRLQGIAKRLRKENASLTAAQAMTQAISENTQLYSEAK